MCCVVLCDVMAWGRQERLALATLCVSLFLFCISIVRYINSLPTPMPPSRERAGSLIVRSLSPSSPSLYLLVGVIPPHITRQIVSHDGGGDIPSSVYADVLRDISSFIHIPPTHSEPLLLFRPPSTETPFLSHWLDDRDTKVNRGQRVVTTVWCLSPSAPAVASRMLTIVDEATQSFICKEGDVFVMMNSLSDHTRDFAATFSMKASSPDSLVGILHYRQ